MKVVLFLVSLALILAGVLGLEKSTTSQTFAGSDVIAESFISGTDKMEEYLRELHASGSDSECESSDSSFENNPEPDLVALSLFSIFGGLFTFGVLIKQILNDSQEIKKGNVKSL